MAEYITEVELPSRGLLYEKYNIPGVFTIRAMTTADEKKILGSFSDVAIDSVIKSCIVDPKTVNMDYLLVSDKYFLMMKLRIHTYGPEYHIKSTCPSCDSTREMTVSLDDFPIYYLDDDFTEPIEFVLPMSQKLLAVKLLRAGEVREIEKESAKYVRKFPEASAEEIEYLIKMARYIEKIDGEELDNERKKEILLNLHARDSAYFWYQLRKIKIGYDTSVGVECSRCRKSFDLSFALTSEFFRPRFDD